MEKMFTAADFDTEVLGSDKPVLVDFFATWCGPCKMMAPAVEKLAEEYEGKAVIGKLDVEDVYKRQPVRVSVLSLMRYIFIVSPRLTGCR